VGRFFPVVRRRVGRFDARADTAFDALRGHPAVDRFFYGASELGDFSLLWLVLAGVRALRSERDQRAAARLVVGLVAESFLINAVVKSLFRRRRPNVLVDRPLRLRVPRTSSFPSGHATSAFVAAVLLSEDDGLWIVYYPLAAVVAASRVYVKIHHASDVLVGAAMGVAMGTVGRRLMPLTDDSEAADRTPAPPIS
jgi:undecaprenyl-diphosphatase